MPRQLRIDALGALHHVMIRGIERREIFQDDKDLESFHGRLASVAKELGNSPSAVSKSIGRGQ
ncbi:MAG: hypothetical protein JRJ39_16620 [Deltaproteobacteria bacterium]|nr:hypothetical protein [Deltaproteobacteria bacterium]